MGAELDGRFSPVLAAETVARLRAYGVRHGQEPAYATMRTIFNVFLPDSFPSDKTKPIV